MQHITTSCLPRVNLHATPSTTDKSLLHASVLNSCLTSIATPPSKLFLSLRYITYLSQTVPCSTKTSEN